MRCCMASAFSWHFFRLLLPASYLRGDILSSEDRDGGSYSIATGVITPLLILAGMMIQSATSISFFVVGIIAFGWVGAVAAQLTVKSPQ